MERSWLLRIKTNKVIPVVIYSNRRGTYLGSRLTKVCRKCKIYEHHGYWSVEGKRRFNSDSASSEFLLSSEDTGFEIDVLAELSNLLVIGAVPFSTYAASYNRRFSIDTEYGTIPSIEKQTIIVNMKLTSKPYY